MKQVLQSLNSGETILENVPCPKNAKETVLIETTKTLVSAGTERMLLAFGKANIIGKIRQQPDKVKAVIEKIKTDGVFATLDAVKAKLDQPIPLGYCNVGKVIAIGDHITALSVGDRVVSNSFHAEVVRAPTNACVKIPNNVSDESAAFTVVGAIALQGIRLSQPTLGECYVVFGLGLIGLLTVQLLIAQGCRVLGVDFDTEKCALANSFGATTVNLSLDEDIMSHAELFSRQRGVDAVIITAATKSNELLHQAATICRKRGRIILIGVIGDSFSRADFYEKEISFQVSCSYGPGRYDDAYEKKGLDYPVGFVRWTQQRNFEAVLDMMAQGKIDVSPLISARFAIDAIVEAYALLEEKSSTLGIVIDYPSHPYDEKIKTCVINHDAIHTENTSAQMPRIGMIGAGNYGGTILAPAFQKTGATLEMIASRDGISAKRLAKKYGFRFAVSDENAVFENKEIHAVVIATRHDQHAQQLIRALDHDKHVFVEKPLCLTLDELAQIQNKYRGDRIIMVGFNRRFSPFVQSIKSCLDREITPKNIIITVNAGAIPSSHWTQDPHCGGGRIIGEACHFIDLLRFLMNSPIKSWQASSIKTHSERLDDNTTITLTFENGSMGTIHYFANGHKKFPKERVDIFCNGKIMHLDNYKKLTAYGFSKLKKMRTLRQDKGQKACVSAFVNAVSNGESSPIPFHEVTEVSRLSIEIASYLRQLK